jgi:hypothetical protein
MLVEKAPDAVSSTNCAISVRERTPLMKAANMCDADFMNILLSSKNSSIASVNAKNERNWTALHFAAERNHSEVTRVLLENGALLNAKTSHGETPLLNAAMHGYADVVDVMLHSLKKFASARVALGQVLEKNNAEGGGLILNDVLDFLPGVESVEEIVNVTNPLFWAVRGGCYHADEATSAPGGMTARAVVHHQKRAFDYKRIVINLLWNGADPNAVDPNAVQMPTLALSKEFWPRSAQIQNRDFATMLLVDAEIEAYLQDSNCRDGPTSALSEEFWPRALSIQNRSIAIQWSEESRMWEYGHGRHTEEPLVSKDFKSLLVMFQERWILQQERRNLQDELARVKLAVDSVDEGAALNKAVGVFVDRELLRLGELTEQLRKVENGLPQVSTQSTLAV